MLFTEFNTNYSKLPAIFRKGSVLLRESVPKDQDKNATIPTMPETLPGSNSAAAICQPLTPLPTLSETGSSCESISEAPANEATESSLSSSATSSVVFTADSQSTSNDHLKRPRHDNGDEHDTDDDQEDTGITSTAATADGTEKTAFKRMKKGVVIDHIDIIGEKFWTGRGAYILAPERKRKKARTE
jgi:tRNA(His) guanylyltransferase